MVLNIILHVVNLRKIQRNEKLGKYARKNIIIEKNIIKVY